MPLALHAAKSWRAIGISALLLLPKASRIAELQFIDVQRSIDAAANSAWGDRKLVPERCASSVVWWGSRDM